MWAAVRRAPPRRPHAPAPRFSDDQVRLILARAAADTTSSEALAHADGHSLAEIERIAAEAGIPQDAVRRAAAVVASGATAPTTIERRSLGIATWFSRRLQAGRRVTGRDWKRIVARLRVLRDAKGNTRDDDSLREWRHRTLRVVVESAPTGDIIHLSARESQPLAVAGVGVILGIFGLAITAFFLGLPATEQARLLWVLGTPVMGIGAVMIGTNVLSLRRWSREHAQLLDTLAEELPRLLDGPPDE